MFGVDGQQQAVNRQPMITFAAEIPRSQAQPIRDNLRRWDKSQVGKRREV